MDKQQLESLIQREAEKRYKGTPAEHARINTFCDGASLLAQPILEAMYALDKYKHISLPDGRQDGSYVFHTAFAKEALQRIKELLGGGK